MKILKEVRKEDDIYYQGAFWIKSDSLADIHRGKFTIIGIKLPCNYDGEYVNEITASKSSLTHKKLWVRYNNGLEDKPFDYLPRGRVAITTNGLAFIHLNSRTNIPKVIDKIIDIYNLHKLNVEIDLNDIYQGSHYNFQLK